MQVQRETNQPEGTIMLENILRISQDQNIPLTILTKSGGAYTGIVIIGTKSVGFVSVNAFLLKSDEVKSVLNKYYSFIRYSEVEAITFKADKGMFDDMLK